jgi:hypothetical protein
LQRGNDGRRPFDKAATRSSAVIEHLDGRALKDAGRLGSRGDISFPRKKKNEKRDIEQRKIKSLYATRPMKGLVSQAREGGGGKKRKEIPQCQTQQAWHKKGKKYPFQRDIKPEGSLIEDVQKLAWDGGSTTSAKRG